MPGKSGALYTAYRLYCQQMNEYTRSTTDFMEPWRKPGLTGVSGKPGISFMD